MEGSLSEDSSVQSSKELKTSENDGPEAKGNSNVENLEVSGNNSSTSLNLPVNDQSESMGIEKTTSEAVISTNPSEQEEFDGLSDSSTDSKKESGLIDNTSEESESPQNLDVAAVEEEKKSSSEKCDSKTDDIHKDVVPTNNDNISIEDISNQKGDKNAFNDPENTLVSPQNSNTTLDVGTANKIVSSGISKATSVGIPTDEQSDDLPAMAPFYRLDNGDFNPYPLLLFETCLPEQLAHSARSKVESLTAKIHESEDKIRLLQQKFLTTKDERDSERKNLTVEQNKARGFKETIANLKEQIQHYSEFKQGTNQMLLDKQERISELTKELETQVQVEKKLRTKINVMENANDHHESRLTQEKFDRAKLQRELDLSQQSVKWYEDELDKRSHELQSVRTTTRAEITGLRTRVDNAEQNCTVATAGKTQLETALQALQSKYDEHTLKIKELSDQNAQQDRLYKEELAKKEKLLTILQESNDERKAYDETLRKIDEDETSYKAKFESFKDDLAQRETRIKDLEDTINDMSTTNIESTVNNGNILEAMSEDGSVDEAKVSSKAANTTLSTSARMVLKGSEYSLTDILAQVSKLRRNLVRERRAKEKAEKELSLIFKELDRRLPLLKSYKEKCTTLEMKQGQFEVILDNLSKEKSMLRTQLTISSKKADELQLQVRQLSQFKVDLQRQLAVLLAEVTVKDHGGALTGEDKAYITNLVGNIPTIQDSTDTGKLITERLTTFRDIAELITKNEQLLIASRNLGSELEAKEKSGSAELQQSENQALIKSKKAILKLQEQLQNTKTQLAAASNSRDILQKLIESNVQNPFQKEDEKIFKQRFESATAKLSDKENEYNALKKEYNTKVFELNAKVQQLMSQNSDVSLKLAKMQSSNQLLQEKNNTSSYFLASAKAENSQLKSGMSSLQRKQTGLEERAGKLTNELLQAKSNQATLEIQLRTMKAAKSMWQVTNGKLHNEVEKLTDEKAKANALIIKLQTLDSERQEQYKSRFQRLQADVDRLQKHLDTVRQKLSSSVEETKRILHSKNADSKSYQERIDQLVSQVSVLKETLNSKSQSVTLLNKNYESLQVKYNEVTERRKANLSSIEGSDTTDRDMVAALRQELNNALEDSKLATQNSVQYKQIAASSEKELNSLNDSFNKYKVSTEGQLSEAQKNIKSLTSQVTKLQEENVQIQGHLDEVTQEYAEQKQKSEEKIRELGKIIESFDGIKNDYDSRLKSAKEEIAEKEENLKDAANQATRSSTTIHKLSEEKDDLSKKMDALQSRLSQLQTSLQKAEMSLKSTNVLFGKEKSDLEEQLKQDQIRITELDAQNRTLMNQLESKSSEDIHAIDESSDMKGLIGYLHRENDSLSQQLQYLKAEEKRLRASVNSKDSELSNLKTQLVEAKEKESVADKYTTLLESMKKESHELQVFKDNNISLRTQLESFITKAKDLESKLVTASSRSQALEKELAGLKSNLVSKSAELEKAQMQLKDLSVKFNTTSGSVSTKAKEIELLNKQKNELLQKVTELQSTKSGKDKEQLRLYQVEIARLNKEIGELNSNLTLVKQELAKKVEETKKQARLAKFAAEPKNSISTANNVREEFKRKVYAKELDSFKKKLEQEKDDYRKKIEAERDAFKKQVETESKQHLLEEMDAYKKRVRAPTNARISEVIEQRWKARSAQLDAQYEAKVKELEEKSRQQMSSENSGFSDIDRSRIKEELEKEKAEVRKEVTASVKRETQFRENILKRQLENLKHKLEKIETKDNINETHTDSIVMSASSVTGSSAPGSSISFLSGHRDTGSSGSFNKSSDSKVPVSVTPDPRAVTLPTKPAKRKSDDDASNVEKRPKTD
ncbi:hypothetical protein BRETT_002315 [Brettanomyces bruxellensis]|uniref:Nucleoprotein TPR/MLP1 domain-containing protein n=1 Tax=Dekkera bruxellensis TaxID=5007 RepID=A0A871R6J3_DEKBR|nr:uncharacterized protein BRETT_002315 [Brettanomyces bruxellensis]QOU22143.1 hypothetical protein BRETT_002315 [Brettanomyces bruxellensis]